MPTIRASIAATTSTIAITLQIGITITRTTAIGKNVSVKYVLVDCMNICILRILN